MGNSVSSVPYGAQISQLNGVLKLSAPGPELIYNFPTVLSVTAPLVGGSGQQVYFSDAVGSVTVPDVYAKSAPQFNSTQYTATIALDLALTHAAPSRYRITQTVHKNWNDTDANVLNFPQAGGVLSPIGPFLLGPAGLNADLVIQYLNVSFQFEDASGAAVGTIPATYEAGEQGFTYVVSSTIVDSSSGPPLAPSNGRPGSFPTTRQNEKSTIVNIAVNCTQDNYNTRTTSLNLTVGGTGPAVTRAGQPFFLTNFNNYFTIPAELALALTFLWGGPNRTYVLATTLGRVPNGRQLGTGLGLSFGNASPNATDIARDFTATDDRTRSPLDTSYYVPGLDNKTETFALPRYGSLTLGPYTAGQSGSQFNIGFTELNAYVAGLDSFYGFSGQSFVVCKPLSPIAFLSAPIIS